MWSKQVLSGSLWWLAPEEGGLRQPSASDHWCRPAWIEPGDIEHVASLTIEGIEPGAPVSPGVTAFWLAWTSSPIRSGRWWLETFSQLPKARDQLRICRLRRCDYRRHVMPDPVPRRVVS